MTRVEDFIVSGHFVTLPLTSGRGVKLTVPMRSGLNWGQRPGRNQDQAYIRIPSDIQKSDFFPPSGEEFTIVCDDDFQFKAIRAQQNGKAIHSLPDNSIMGIYFRQRLGLEKGAFVVLEHLLEYGRHTVRIHKTSIDLLFYLDFKKVEANEPQ